MLEISAVSHVGWQCTSNNCCMVSACCQFYCRLRQEAASIMTLYLPLYSYEITSLV